MINATFRVNGGARPASELAEIARRALDDHLGFALQDQLDGPDPAGQEAARVFADYYALAARQTGTVTLNDAECARLVAEGRSAQHMRKLDLLVRHSLGSQPLSDHHLKLQLDAIGIEFRQQQADSDRRIMLTAWAEAQQRAACFHSADVQAHPHPIRHLLDVNHRTISDSSTAQSASPLSQAGSAKATTEVVDRCAPTNEPTPLLSSIISKVIAGIVRAGNWKAGPGGVAEDAERLIRQFCWMVGDLAVDRYTQWHVGEFDREMMAMPKGAKVQRVWGRSYAIVKAEFAPLTPATTRNPRTMNKDLAYLSTFADRMVSEGYWAKGVIQPLLLSHKVTRKQKEKAKSPWKM